MNTSKYGRNALVGGEYGYFYTTARMIFLVVAVGMIVLGIKGCGAIGPILENQPPVAQVAKTSAVTVGENVELNGSASFDPDGDPLTCEWLLQQGPQAVELKNADTSTAEFTPVKEGDYHFSFTVSDGRASSKASVVVEVLSATEPKPDPDPNPDPVAVVESPVFDPPAETNFRETLDLTISCVTAGAAIYYTTDGSTPSAETATLYSESIRLNQTTILKAIAVCDGMTASEVTEAVYYQLGTAEMPVFDSSDGETFQYTTDVTICCQTEGVEIYYTTDGSKPDATNGTRYVEPIQLDDTTVLNAIACKEGMVDSPIASASFAKLGTVHQPQFEPSSGQVFQVTLDVTISDATEGASIYYTTDGSTPTAATGTLYAGPIQLTDTTTLNAIACKDGLFDSPVVSAEFTRQETVAMPQFGLGNDPFFQDSRQVEISCDTPGATICYTTDGRRPGADYGYVYTGPITLTSSTTIKAIAYAEGMFESPIASAGYTKIYPVANPIFDPSSGLAYQDSIDVRIVCPTEGVTIHYTTDGSEPSPTSGLLYTAPIRLTTTATIKAMAFKYAMIDSSVVSATYTKVANSGTKKWAFETGGELDSSPAIGYDGTIYVGSFDRNLYAIHPNGSLKWSFATSAVIFSSPAVSGDGTVYIGSNDGRLYAVTSVGQQKWIFDTGKPILSSPAIGSDGTVYIHVDGTLFAITPSGSKKWQHTLPATGSYNYSSPAVAHDGTIYVGSVDRNLYAINSNGTRKWAFATGGHLQSSAAIDSDGTIYIGSGDGKLYAISPDGTLKWTFTTGWYIDSSAAIGSDGTIYVGSADGKLYAINPNGNLKWSYATNQAIQASPTICSDGTIYIGSLNRVFYAIKPDGTLRWSFLTQDAIDSSPAIGSDGTIYIGSKDGKLYALVGAGRLANSPWPRFHRNARQTGNTNSP